MKNYSLLLLFIAIVGCQSDEVIPVQKESQEKEPEIEQVDLPGVDRLVTHFLAKYSIPGASLAVAKQEKLVYQKPYGLSNIDKGDSVTNETIFRIASCTKLYTSIAILKLMEDEKLNIDDPVFGEGAVLGTKYGSQPYSENLKKVTVRNLLQQTSGHFVNVQGQDLMHFRYDLDSEGYLSWLVDNHVQEFDAGNGYRYLNANYFIASKIVEQVSGQNYEDYLKEAVLDLIGDEYTKLAVNDELIANEARAYGQGSLLGREYEVSYDRNFGSGGLLGNGRTLVQLITSIDGKNVREEILPSNLLQELITPSTVNQNFALGISVSPQYFSFSGALAGTRSMWFYNRNTGIAVALVLNGYIDFTNSELATEFNTEMQNVLASIMNGNVNYQDIDQF